MNDPVETAELVAFVRIVETGALSRAARELGIPRATLSRRLQRLEERLGVRLLRRTTRRQSLTDAGRALFPYARQIVDTIRTAEAAVQRSDGAVSGILRVGVPPSDRLNEMLLDFAARYPDVTLEVTQASEMADIAGGRCDVALRAASALDPGLIARPLMRMCRTAVASPEYLAEYGTPDSLDDLADHRCLVGYERGTHPVIHWPTVRGPLRVSATLASNSIGLLRDATLRGMGIALLPKPISDPFIESGQLQPVLAGELGGDSIVAIVYAERELQPPALRAFVDFVTARIDAGIDDFTLPPPP